MNDYVVPKEVIEWAKKEIKLFSQYDDWYSIGYCDSLELLLTKINVVYTKDTE